MRFSQLSNAIYELVGDIGCAASHGAFAMLRRRFGCRATNIRSEDLATAVRLIEERRRHADVLRKTMASLSEDHNLRWDVMRPAVRRAFDDEPGTAEDFQRYIDELLFVSRARPRRKKARLAQTQTKTLTNVVCFDRARAKKILSNIVQKFNERNAALGEIPYEPVDARDPGYDACIEQLMHSFSQSRSKQSGAIADGRTN
jgi:hypothetical protein